MILDNDTLVAKKLAHDGTVTAIDLGTAKAGPGESLTMFVNGSALAGATGIIITDCDTVGGSYADVQEIDATAAELNAGIQFTLPTNIRQFVKVDLVGTTTAGTWNCGLILPGMNLNP